MFWTFIFVDYHRVPTYEMFVILFITDQQTIGKTNCDSVKLNPI